ncbi:MAG: hypothetical protein EOO29_13245 [Comamonadaceae bacterium]|nr:MAG: hypothetical protein EOO29_13245 [Comamonadaceae bacterium]
MLFKVKKLHEVSDVATNKIAQLTDELNAARREAAGAKAEHLALQAAVSAQKQMSEQLDGLRKTLEACRQDATRARTEVQALRSTVSWRVTQPLRWVRRLWR